MPVKDWKSHYKPEPKLVKKKKKKKRTFFSRFTGTLAVLLGLIIFMIPVSLAVVMYYNEPPAQIIYKSQSALEMDGIRLDENGDFYIDIRKGESAQSVGNRLERTGLIRSRHFWNLLCRYYKDTIKTGTYRLQVPATQISINRLLVSGRQILHRVTIPEGVTIKKAAKILEDAGICSAVSFIEASQKPEIISRWNIPNESIEGYLFPDTYMFPAEYPAERVIRSMADNFFSKLNAIYSSASDISDGQGLSGASSLSPQEINNMVILASIIEREYRVTEEAPVMAGVFYNRMKIGMALQSCATVEYIITEIQNKPHPKVIYNADLEIRDPYNTYIYPGLPPGPISAPGRIALEAAINPVKSEYLYFRLNDAASGKHYFSKTYDEHIRAGQLITKGSP